MRNWEVRKWIKLNVTVRTVSWLSFYIPKRQNAWPSLTVSECMKLMMKCCLRAQATWYMHFRGQALVQSMIEALFRDHGLRKATKIYLSGESAGARGMMTWIDELVSSYLVTRSNDCAT